MVTKHNTTLLLQKQHNIHIFMISMITCRNTKVNLFIYQCDVFSTEFPHPDYLTSAAHVISSFLTLNRNIFS